MKSSEISVAVEAACKENGGSGSVIESSVTRSFARVTRFSCFLCGVAMLAFGYRLEIIVAMMEFYLQYVDSVLFMIRAINVIGMAAVLVSAATIFMSSDFDVFIVCSFAGPVMTMLSMLGFTIATRTNDGEWFHADGVLAIFVLGLVISCIVVRTMTILVDLDRKVENGDAHMSEALLKVAHVIALSSGISLLVWTSVMLVPIDTPTATFFRNFWSLITAILSVSLWALTKPSTAKSKHRLNVTSFLGCVMASSTSLVVFLLSALRTQEADILFFCPTPCVGVFLAAVSIVTCFCILYAGGNDDLWED